MNKGIYAIRDRLANDLVGMQMYLLMIFTNDQTAARYFADAINDNTSILNKHPGDYELISLGTVSQGGEITPEPIRHIITGDALLALQEVQLVKDA